MTFFKLPFIYRLTYTWRTFYNVPTEVSVNVLKYIPFQKACELGATDRQLDIIATTSPPDDLQYATDYDLLTKVMSTLATYYGQELPPGTPVPWFMNGDHRTFAYFCRKHKKALLYSLHFVFYKHPCLIYLAYMGRLDLLQVLHQYFPEELYKDIRLARFAALRGHLDCIEWMSSLPNIKLEKDLMDFAADHGQLEVVKWLHYNAHPGGTPNAINWSAAQGHFAVVKFLCQNGYTFTMFGIRCARNRGHEAIAQFLEQRVQHLRID